MKTLIGALLIIILLTSQIQKKKEIVCKRFYDTVTQTAAQYCEQYINKETGYGWRVISITHCGSISRYGGGALHGGELILIMER